MDVEGGVQWVVFDSAEDGIVFIVFSLVSHMSGRRVICRKGSLAASNFIVALAH